MLHIEFSLAVSSCLRRVQSLCVMFALEMNLLILHSGEKDEFLKNIYQHLLLLPPSSLNPRHFQLEKVRDCQGASTNV